MAAARFSVGEAEGLRRAMSRKRSEEAIEAFRPRFVEGCLGNGIDEPTAHTIYDKLVGFSGFGFPKSHAAAFGLLAYQSAWLRRYYPAEFLCSLLNAQPMGFYPPASLVRDAQRRGVEVRPPHVNISGARCTVEAGAVRVGLGYIRSVGAGRGRGARRRAALRRRRRPRQAQLGREGRARGARRLRRLRRRGGRGASCSGGSASRRAARPPGPATASSRSRSSRPPRSPSSARRPTGS